VEGHVVESFVFPFRRGGRGARWLVGVVMVALLPVSFLFLFGYAVACVRSAAADPAAPPPAWRVRGRTLFDGAWSALQAAAITLPFAAAAWWLAGALGGVWHPTGDRALDAELVWIAALTLAALPWGLLMLLAVPPTLARFAVSGRPADLVAVRAAIGCVRERYVAWNLVLVAITTSWVLAAASLALAGVGVVAGAFYAILVSAHACAALVPTGVRRTD